MRSRTSCRTAWHLFGQGIAPETAEPGSSHQEGSTFNRDYGVQGLWVWAEEECGPNTAVLDYERSLGLKELRGLSSLELCVGPV